MDAKVEAKNGDLKVTVDGMLSVDYTDRFRAEYTQLVIRLAKLENMVERWKAGELNFVPTCPYSTYELQIEYMRKYKAILEARAKMENVEL